MTMAPVWNSRKLTENNEMSQKNIEEDFIFQPDRGTYKFLIWEFKTRVLWSRVIIMSAIHMIAVYSLATHRYIEKPGIFIYSCILHYMAGFGITAGVHRYYTHRSYKAKLPLKLIILLCYSIAGQYSIKQWVRDHRVHHKYSETDADPYDSRRGFFFSHVGWLMMKKRPEVIKKGQQIDCSDLFEEPLVVFYERYFIWITLLGCFIVPIVIPPLAWGESWIISINASITKYVVSLNCTWLVNSAAHMWGNKPYDKKICPVENGAVAVITMGEGYHNYHHTFPWDYRAAEIGAIFNGTTLFLNFFEKIGWAYDMKSASPELIRKMIQSSGDGSHRKWGHELTEENAKAMMEKLYKTHLN